MLTIGILPPCPEIWRRGGRVVGISEYRAPKIPRRCIGAYIGYSLGFFFLSMDLLGVAFSLFALGISFLGWCERGRLNVNYSCSRTLRRRGGNNVQWHVRPLVPPRRQRSSRTRMRITSPLVNSINAPHIGASSRPALPSRT